MSKGTCKLCLQDRELRESHLMPRSLYRKARGSGEKGNQDPYLMRKDGGKQTSYQVKDYVLCGDCEQLFNKNGERYVLELVAKRNGDFPLIGELKRISPDIREAEWVSYSITSTPNIDRAKIAYFAISVFWRASVHSWKHEDGEVVRIDLGKKYNEELRKYLLGETPPPKNASLIVTVCTDLLNRMTFFEPQENQKHKDRSFVFLARGLMFFFRMSNTLVPYQRRISIVNESHGWITVRDCGKHPVWWLG